MVIAVWRQAFGGSSGGWRTLGRPSRGDSEAGRSGQISPGWVPEAVGERGGAGAVVAEPAGLVAAGGGRGQHPGAGAAGVLAGPGHGQADREVRVRGRRAGRPGGDGDGGLQRPADLPQRLALVVLALAVVAL